MRTRVLRLIDVEYVSHRLAKEMMSWSEPIPDFSTRYTNSLERCLEAPFQTFDQKQLYPGLIKKSAILFYLMIKNHPSQNGNKRIALATLLYFLYLHRKWLKVDNQELYNFARWIAESNAKLKDSVVKAIQDFIRVSLIDLK